VQLFSRRDGRELLQTTNDRLEVLLGQHRFSPDATIILP